MDASDERRGDVRYSMAGIGLSAFSLFSMQSTSFLSYQRGPVDGVLATMRRRDGFAPFRRLGAAC